MFASWMMFRKPDVSFAWAFPVSLVIFVIIRMTVGFRVSEAEELQGLDIVEHGIVLGVVRSQRASACATRRTLDRDSQDERT